ncbi:M16 family metallopeptidase [Pelagibacterium halotolerans]|uniref:M16 family metallopeptidase n=1 Tax=Pelagibacterium halotolerans TaxID=531813 RepID=UPI00384B1E5F
MYALDPGPLAGAWLVTDPRADRVEVDLIILSGEADNPGTEGLAHYVEHLAWLNATDPTRGDFAVHSNASTTSIDTAYWLEGPTGELDEMVATLAGVLEPFSLDEPFMIEERDIVLHEYTYSMSEDPYAPIMDDFARREHANGPLARSVIGTPEDIAAFSLAEARALHSATHRRDNSVLLIYGNVDAEDANLALASAFGTGTGGGMLKTPSYAMPPEGRDERILEDTGLPLPALIYSKIVTLDHPHDIATLYFETWLLAAALDSRLPGGVVRALQYNSFIAQNYQLDVSLLDDRHVRLSFSATPDAGVPLETLLEVFEDAVAQSAASGIPDETLARVRQRIVDTLRRDPDPALVVFDSAFEAIGLGLAPWDFDSYPEAVERVDLAQVNALLASLASSGRTTITLAYP